MSESSLRDALKELRTYCGKYVDDPDASEAEQLAYDDVCIQLAQILDKHPAEPVGVSDEAVEAAAKALRDRWTIFSSVGALAYQAASAALEAARPLMGATPARPTLEQIREALAAQYTAVELEGGYICTVLTPEAAEAAVLALMGGAE